MKDPEQLWFDLVSRFAAQSRCRSRQVGAIIVKNDKLIGQGWNGAPAGCNTNDCPRCNLGTSKSGENLETAICAHAEANAVANCVRAGIATEGAILYSSLLPCGECSKLLVGAGIKEVVYDQEYGSELSKTILRNGSVKLRNFCITKICTCDAGLSATDMAEWCARGCPSCICK